MPSSKSKPSVTTWPRVFEQHLNAGDLDAVMALYEPEARFVTKSGETLIGRDRLMRLVALPPGRSPLANGLAIGMRVTLFILLPLGIVAAVAIVLLPRQA